LTIHTVYLVNGSCLAEIHRSLAAGARTISRTLAHEGDQVPPHTLNVNTLIPRARNPLTPVLINLTVLASVVDAALAHVIVVYTIALIRIRVVHTINALALVLALALAIGVFA
jgi:hypothetical protein